MKRAILNTLHDHRSRARQSGQAIILMAVMMVALMGMLGLTIDGGGLFLLRRDTQNAVDAALVRALYAKCTNDPRAMSAEDFEASIRSAALEAASVNGFDDGINGASVIVEPFFQPPGTTKNHYVKVTIIALKPSYFIQLIYPEQLQVTTSGVGHCAPTRANLLPPAGIVSLSLGTWGCTGTNATFNVVGNGSVEVYNSGIWVNSSNPTCALRAAGNGNLWVEETCAVIGGAGTAGGSGNPVIDCQEGIDHPTDPWDTSPMADVDPPVEACDGPASSVNSGGTISPGHYSKIRTGNKNTITLQPGIYCINEIDYQGGRIEGSDVVIYMPPRNRGMRGNGGNLNLRAPTRETCEDANPETCEWLGLLLWADFDAALENPPTTFDTDSQYTINLNGNSSSEVTGMIYAPRHLCSLDGNGDLHVVGQVICWGVQMDGNGDKVVIYDQPQFLQVPPSVSLFE